MKETWDAVFSSICVHSAGFLFHEVLLRLPCSISYFQWAKSHKMAEYQGENWTFGLKSIAYYSRRQQAYVKGQDLGFPLISDFNIDFQYLIVKRHGFTCIFNLLKFESCMSLKVAFKSGFQSCYLKYKNNKQGDKLECPFQEQAIFTLSFVQYFLPFSFGKSGCYWSDKANGITCWGASSWESTWNKTFHLLRGEHEGPASQEGPPKGWTRTFLLSTWV